ncbi:MAG: hypothetical protein A2Y74_07825 [Actinobacteria bacterium RBG_13_63_9]|nr:MAG: hypothetical protein A2Y74_07825 [Actinobacteria bacterium RBG_13_63_9]
MLQPVRRLEGDQRLGHGRNLSHESTALRRLARQEAEVVKTSRREARCGESRGECRRSRHGDDMKAGGNRRFHEMDAGIADSGRTRLRNKGNVTFLECL